MNRMLRTVALCAVSAFVPLHAAEANGSRELSLESITTLDASQGQIPESITTDRFGNLYFSSAGRSSVVERSPGGARMPDRLSADRPKFECDPLPGA